MTLIGLSIICILGSGCDFRDRRYSSDVAPNAAVDGLRVALLSFHEERGCLLCEIELQNPSMHTFKLQCSDVHPAWCSLSWDEHRVTGIPAVEESIPDGDQFAEVDVRDPIVLLPYSTQKFHVRFGIKPSLASTRQQVSISVEALDEVSNELRHVVLPVPTV